MLLPFNHKWITVCLVLFASCIFTPAFSQEQSCPANINFASGDLTHWFAYTGNNKDGNGPTAIMERYDSTVAAPAGTIGASTIYEYQLPAVPGINVNTTGGTDFFGGFPKIPVINGYQYSYSILLGSTSITHSNSNGTAGGYIRGISYNISVPAGPPTEPYTMTYAYAMVLENGAHNSNEQPLFRATLQTADSTIYCASPQYFLPTLDNAVNHGMATLDTAGALAEGFTPSRQPSPNVDPNNSNSGQHLYDVWWKSWREVTFDLSPYRGQQVTLTFEADNCRPGGHFAYAYVALRNSCGGLIISGDSDVCINNNNLTYSVPALGGGNYQWSVPTGWTIISGDSTNIITVKAGALGGKITANEQNSCANLNAVLPVTTATPPVGGIVASNARVCAGNNSNTLTVTGQVGNILEWIASPDGINWTDIADKTTTYTAQNLTTTTIYKAVIQTSIACPNDSGTAAVITVDPKSVGGVISPANSLFCLEQDRYGILSLSGNTGSVVDWQTSGDGINWSNVVPLDTDSSYNATNITSSTDYRTIVKSGVCPADTSAIAAIQLFDVYFPKTTIDPADTSVCYGAHVPLTAVIGRGSSYAWAYTDVLNNQGDGSIPSTPYTLTADAAPIASTNYILNIENEGCPVILKDTFHINVVPPFVVSAGHDTSIVINQPLQLQATSTDITSNTFTWTPAFNLDNPNISNPVATFGAGVTNASYTVTGIDSTGCFAKGTINIKIYDLSAGLYVPTAFTPNGDGLNDVFKPILLGIKALTLFSIYNRWGQLVFSTSNPGQGWDGTFGGVAQNGGAYVWIADGIDYNGTVVKTKGNVILIR